MDVYFGVTLQEITEVGKDSLSGVFWLNLNWAENTNDKVSR